MENFDLPDLPLVVNPLLGAERDESMYWLMGKIAAGDAGTPRVVESLCRKLPKDRIDRVTGTLRNGVPPGVAVSALKREVQAYEQEIAA